MPRTLRANGIQIDTAVISESQTTDLPIEGLRRALPSCTVTRVPRYL